MIPIPTYSSYQHQTLFDIRSSHKTWIKHNLGDELNINNWCLYRRTDRSLTCCHHTEEDWGSVAVFCGEPGAYLRYGCGCSPSAIQVDFFWVSNRWVDPACCFCCFLPNLLVETYLTRLWWARHHSVHYRNLRAPSFTPTTSRKNGIVCLALINTRGLKNKTFLLNEFFTSPELDFIFLTETWLCTGEFTPFLELLPPDCLFFSSSQTAGRGGRLTTVFKSSFQCQ